MGEVAVLPAKLRSGRDIAQAPPSEVSALKVFPNGPVTLALKLSCPTGMVTANPG